MAIRRAKLVCTLGPACDSEEGLRSLIDAGMDVARLNFSHGTHEEHKARLLRLRQASLAQKKEVAALQDLCGPKVRTGTFPKNFDLPAGVDVTLMEGDHSADERVITIQYEGLAARRSACKDKILFDDGRLVLEVTAIERRKTRSRARVQQGGGMRNHVGVHLPSKTMRISALTEKDKEDLIFGLVVRHGLRRPLVRAARGRLEACARNLSRVGQAHAGHREDRNARRRWKIWRA